MFRSSAVALRSPAVVVLSLGLLAGCGGQVVFVEDDGSGGSGAGGAGPGPGPGPGPSQTSTNNTTSTGTTSTCQQFCSLYAACVDGECISTCENLFNGQCDPQVTALLSCFVTEYSGGCEPLEDACFPEIMSYGECQNANQCFTDSCDAGPEGCFCTGFCNNGQQIDQQCFTFPDGGPPPPGGQPATCDCYLDGNYVGSCDTAGFECSIEEGCCQQMVGGIK